MNLLIASFIILLIITNCITCEFFHRIGFRHGEEFAEQRTKIKQNIDKMNSKFK
ncbi:hypothetical protein CLJ_0263 (plasmid) [Clostridium botulinum Ba4 str. 657]|uniref:Uncharacterized protein n=1 Tax=Clostridium botulinum (strain 657 / Type Ba4) TaxID=515621 RepID=A0A3F2ZPS3_CLOB6|nr:hypothetical protein CLJ_0263 [Clostridium botulinum Ba4 str. 657]